MRRSHRKNLARAAAALFAMAVLAGCGDGAPESVTAPPAPPDQAPQTQPPGKRPNVLLIVLDTTRGDRCSVNGYERRTTPTLEALAGEGVRFRDCWSPASWTAPAHASLFTGLRPAHHGLIGGSARFHLERIFETLAERLREAGYSTSCYTANEFIQAPYGLTQGFDSLWGSWQGHEEVFPVAAYAHGLALEWALEQHREGKPFFAFINDMEPHTPYDPPPSLAERFLTPGTTDEEIAEGGQFRHPRTLSYTLGVHDETPRYLKVVSDLYDAEIASVDAALEPLFEGLRTAGALDDTIVIVTGDHGENLGERHMAEHVFSSNRTVLHVPLVIRYPEAFAAGTTVDDVVRLEDVFPTVLELCGLEPRGAIDGASLLGALPNRIARADVGEQTNALGAAERDFPQADLAPFRVSMRSVYDGRYHLIEHSDGAVEFYDVSADPLELTDLAPSSPDGVERLRALLED